MFCVIWLDCYAAFATDVANPAAAYDAKYGTDDWVAGFNHVRLLC